MRMSKVLRVFTLFPFAWVSAVCMEGRPFEENFDHAAEWSRFLLKYLGYSLEVRSEADLKEGRGYYFISNHQGTLDPAVIAATCPCRVHFVSKKQNEKIILPFLFTHQAESDEYHQQ